MLNNITIMGRLTKDPELRRTDSGKAVTSFSIACDRDFKTDIDVDFFSCVSFGKTAEFIDSYFSKGKMISILGKLQNRSWAAKDGTKRTVTEIIANHVYFADSKNENVKKDQEQTYGIQDQSYSFSDYDEDCPF